MKKRLALVDIKAGSVWTEDVSIDDSNLLVPAGIASFVPLAVMPHSLE